MTDMDPDSDDFTERLKVAIESAEVVSVFFVRVGHSLIMDLRPDPESEPVVVVDRMAESPYQRLLSFSNLRPTLSLPDEITLAPWTERVTDFQESGVMDVFLARCRSAGGDQLASDANSCFGQLLELERNAMKDMIRGIGMQTLWQRDANGD
ncbi:MAG: hypothetical protein AB7V46_05685 [Thermomicrobiales bacterium]